MMSQKTYMLSVSISEDDLQVQPAAYDPVVSLADDVVLVIKDPGVVDGRRIVAVFSFLSDASDSWHLDENNVWRSQPIKAEGRRALTQNVQVHVVVAVPAAASGQLKRPEFAIALQPIKRDPKIGGGDEARPQASL